MMTPFHLFQRLRRSIPVALLGAGLMLLPVNSGHTADDWGNGFYRINPSKDRPFSPGTTQKRDNWGSKFTIQPTPDKTIENNRRYDDRRASPSRSLPQKVYRDRRDTYEPKRSKRPWGEIPPEWRNEDLDQYSPPEPSTHQKRRALRYDDVPYYDYEWSLPRDRPYGKLDSWDYPYRPNRTYRRGDGYQPSPYYYDDRYRDERWRPRDPSYDYFDGNRGWWDAP